MNDLETEQLSSEFTSRSLGVWLKQRTGLVDSGKLNWEKGNKLVELDSCQFDELLWSGEMNWSAKSCLDSKIEFLDVKGNCICDCSPIEVPEAGVTTSNLLESEGLLLMVVVLSSVHSLSAMMGLWVLGSMPLCRSLFLMLEFQKFFISLSVLPGN